MKRIIISYASYGGGHYSAAKNLKEYIEENYPDCDVFLFDCMKYINKVIDKVCGSTYSTITTNIPWFWGKIYYHTQEPIFEKITSLSNKLLSYKLVKLFKNIEPDIIISTHFFVSHMCSILKQNKKINAKIATIITDYGNDPYNEWVSNFNYIDYIFVAHNEIKNILLNKKIPENKIYPTGIPISKNFLIHYDKSVIFNKLNLSENKKTVLFFGGGELGLGKSKTLDIYNLLIKNYSNIQIIAIAGKNETLKNNFIKIANENNRLDSTVILGYTTYIPELMYIADLVVTKPGGLTSTEALVSNIPIIAINPIPGQEEENANFLETNGAAIWIKKNDNINTIFDNIFNNNEILLEMKNNIKQIAKPNSTKEICEILLKNDL